MSDSKKPSEIKINGNGERDENSEDTSNEGRSTNDSAPISSEMSDSKKRSKPEIAEIRQISTTSFELKFGKNGEPKISKKLCDIVRENILPYNEILYHYFEGIVFVVILANFLCIIMSLAQKSGVFESVLMIGAMAAITLHLIFDLFWKKNSEEQKAANDIAMKSKVKSILVTCNIVLGSNSAT